MSNDLSLRVKVEEGASMVIPNPIADPHIEYALRYATDLNSGGTRFVAAELIGNYDYLCSHNITLKEAVRRLRILREARKTAFEEPSQ